MLSNVGMKILITYINKKIFLTVILIKQFFYNVNLIYIITLLNQRKKKSIISVNRGVAWTV